MANDHDVFHEIASNLGLGTVTAQPRRVSGGYMHKMYCLETSRGKYAVKLLNPGVMKRSDVFKNYEIAEHFEQILEEKDIPIIPTLEFDGRKMQCLRGQYYYVFDWIEGKALKSNEIRKEHCEIAGSLLAKIHRVVRWEEAFDHSEIHIDWDKYIDLALEQCPNIANLIKKNRALLYSSQDEGNLALKRIPAVACICNGDMDSKNVLWINDEPYIIDLECLSYGNPYMELFQLALCWSGYEHCAIDYDLLGAFIREYIKVYGDFQVDWSVLYSSNFGRLEWLEYNLKRALMIECENEDERKLGIEQVFETIDHIVYYHDIKEELLDWFNTYFGLKD